MAWNSSHVLRVAGVGWSHGELELALRKLQQIDVAFHSIEPGSIWSCLSVFIAPRASFTTPTTEAASA
jgi:hypothetical protein